MHINLKSIIAMLLLFLVSAVYSHTNTKESFVKLIVEEIPGINVCKAGILFDVLDDREKGLMQVGLDLMNSESDISQHDVGKLLSKLYDSDKELKKSIELKWKNAESLITSEKNKCINKWGHVYFTIQTSFNRKI